MPYPVGILFRAYQSNRDFAGAGARSDMPAGAGVGDIAAADDAGPVHFPDRSCVQLAGARRGPVRYPKAPFIARVQALDQELAAESGKIRTQKSRWATE